MISLLGLLCNACTPIPLSVALQNLFESNSPMSLLDIILKIEKFTQCYSHDKLYIEYPLQKLFNTHQSCMTIEKFNKYLFLVVPLVLIDYNGYYLIVNNNHYQWEDLQLDNTMFNIVLMTCKKSFKNLPSDVVRHIKKFLFDGKLPFINSYYFTVYESKENHDAKLLEFWRRI